MTFACPKRPQFYWQCYSNCNCVSFQDINTQNMLHANQGPKTYPHALSLKSKLTISLQLMLPTQEQSQIRYNQLPKTFARSKGLKLLLFHAAGITTGAQPKIEDTTENRSQTRTLKTTLTTRDKTDHRRQTGNRRHTRTPYTAKPANQRQT